MRPPGRAHRRRGGHGRAMGRRLPAALRPRPPEDVLDPLQLPLQRCPHSQGLLGPLDQAPRAKASLGQAPRLVEHRDLQQLLDVGLRPRARRGRLPLEQQPLLESCPRFFTHFFSMKIALLLG